MGAQAIKIHSIYLGHILLFKPFIPMDLKDSPKYDLKPRGNVCIQKGGTKNCPIYKYPLAWPIKTTYLRQ